ncbi:MAG: hypothetical protein E7620_08360 [Ruminococcaceae bacterium]|nr:hypothetical protein [Oscillospiraceae bacterium]
MMKRYWRLLLTVAALLLLLTSCGAQKKPVATVGENEILYEELRHEVLTYLSNHKTATEEELRAAVEQQLLETYALLLLCAEELNATPDSEGMKEAVDAELEKAISALGGEQQLADYLKEVYLTEDLMRRKLAITKLQMDLEAKLFRGTRLESKDTLMAWLDQGNYVRVRRVFIPGALGEETAATLREQIIGGAQLSGLLTAEQKQAGAEIGANEYFYRDLNGSAEELAAMELSRVGQCSSLLTNSEGYTFFVRVEDDRQTVADYQAITVLERFREAELAPLIQAKASELTLTWNEYGASIRLSDIQ